MLVQYFLMESHFLSTKFRNNISLDGEPIMSPNSWKTEI